MNAANLANCSCCGKLILTRFEKQCRDCLQLYLDDSRTVKSYLAAHPRASAIDVCAQTGISLRRVKELLDIR